MEQNLYFYLGCGERIPKHARKKDKKGLSPNRRWLTSVALIFVSEGIKARLAEILAPYKAEPTLDLVSEIPEPKGCAVSVEKILV